MSEGGRYFAEGAIVRNVAATPAADQNFDANLPVFFQHENVAARTRCCCGSKQSCRSGSDDHDIIDSGVVGHWCLEAKEKTPQ